MIRQNPPRKLVFVAKMHPEHGYLGWQLEGHPEFEPLTGFGIAHDCLEHFAGDQTDLANELMAFGSILWLRHGGGYWRYYTQQREPDFVNNMAYDLTEFLMKWHWGEIPWSVHKSGRFARPLDDEEAEGQLDRLTAEMLRSAEGNYNDEDVRAVVRLVRQHAEEIKHWIRTGFRRAKKRYAPHSAEEIVHALFRPIEEAADKYLKHAEEGAQMTVYVNARKPDVHIEYKDLWELYNDDDAY